MLIHYMASSNSCQSLILANFDRFLPRLAHLVKNHFMISHVNLQSSSFDSYLAKTLSFF